ncbi:MAG: PilZ domain-containing protein [Planctomycetota bacterium]|jgi:hypothetical protein
MGNRAVGLAPHLKDQIRGYTAGGMEPEVVEKILRGYFSGLRDGVRTYTFLDVQVQGTGGSYKAVAVDISRSGMLFRITDDRFAAENRVHPLMPYTARVWHNFEGGFHVHLGGGQISTAAEIVRVTGYSGRENSLILIGCRFETPLSPEQCDTLGIAHDDDRRPPED